MARMDGDFSASDDENEPVKVDQTPYQGKKTVAFKKQIKKQKSNVGI